MKVLVTGGFGFVGRNFVKELLDRGFKVHSVDNLIKNGGGIAPGREWIGGDPTKSPNFSFDVIDCRKFFSSNQFSSWDLVIHLAAVVGGRLTIERDPLAVAEDLSIDAEFWLWATKVKPKKILHFSSSAAYPINLQSRQNNRALLESDIDFLKGIEIPDMTYGWSKLTSEYLSIHAVKNYGLEVITFRPFSGYGEDQDLSYPFPSIMKRVAEFKIQRESDEFKVWGSGLQKRDFIHITDIVRIALSVISSNAGADVLNIGTGVPTSFLDLANLALSKAGIDAIVVGQKDMPEGVFARYANIEKMMTYAESPAITLDEGVSLSLEKFSSKI